MAGLSLVATGVDGARTVLVAGELDISVAPELAAMLADLGDVDITLDLRDVQFIDSSAISTFLAAHQRLEGARRRLTLRGLRPAPRRVLELVGVAEILHVEDDVPD